MIYPERNLPFSTVALIFGSLGVPLAFARHLVSLALVLGLMALLLGAIGTWHARRSVGSYKPSSIRRASWAMGLGMLATLCATVMWVLWATNALLAEA